MIKVCPECNHEFNTFIGKRVFCSRKCSIHSRKTNQEYLLKLRKPKERKEQLEYQCKYCSVKFFSSNIRKYCSPKCGNQDRLLGKGYLIPIECKECKNIFKPVRSTNKYCSTECSINGKLKDPLFLLNLKESCKKRSLNPDYLQKLSDKAKKRWNDPKFREKMDQIFLSDDWLSKSTDSYLTKTFVFPSGVVEKIQGYEDKALIELLEKYSEEDIIVNKSKIKSIIGIIEYYDENGAKHRYTPDIYIISENRIIEVKSSWTYQINQDINERKREACIKKGHDFTFLIY